VRSSTESLTKLLNAAAADDRDSAGELLALIYEELRDLARGHMRGQPPGTRLQPTELVHEAYVRLFNEPIRGERGTPSAAWNSRAHFFGTAAQAMRNILVEQARRRGRLKRGGGRKRLALDDHEWAISPPADDVLALDEFLAQLESSHPRKARLVLLHCFSGLTLEESASAMSVSLSTIQREWRFTRALLESRLEDRKSTSL
jgi:RNA polymerase sigma factor (TIGR02999 family)